MAVDNARLYREAQEAIRARDEFLSVAAHELKTPITSMRLSAQSLLRRLDKEGILDPQRVRQAMHLMDQQSDKLSRLIAQLLDIARIEAGRLTITREVTDLTRLVETVAATAQTRSTQHTLIVDTVPSVKGAVDPLRLEQVLINLIDNAFKYSPAGGRIEIGLSLPSPDLVRLTVRDWGTGIPPEKRAQIFNRFYQGDASHHAGGMGLGLYISRQIVELHGGQIEAEFPPDGGTCFVVSLPTGLAAST